MTIQYRREIIEAIGGAGLIGNEKQFWNTLLTSLGYAGPAVATETAFWRAFVTAIGDYSPALPDDQAVVEDGDTFAATGGTVTISVAGGVASAEYTPD